MRTKAKSPKNSRSSLHEVGIEGILLTISPLPLMLMSLSNNKPDFPIITDLPVTISIVASLLLFLSAFLILRSPLTGKITAALALTGSSSLAISYLVTNPFAAFMAAIILIITGFYLFDYKAVSSYEKQRGSSSQERSQQRVRYGLITIPVVLLFRVAIGSIDTICEADKLQIDAALAASAIILQILLLHCASRQNRRYISSVWTIFSIGTIAILVSCFYKGYNIPVAVIISSLITLLFIRPSIVAQEHYGHWWEMFINHPARMMLTTFMGLCILGAILLVLPIAAADDAINLLDAAFTSVSAVCVTGLIVLDTPTDFSIVGQIFIMILIQLGGLGIMSITTVGMHAMGRRLTLRQERLMTTVTDTDHKDLIQSLAIILKFTLTAEGLGGLILTLLFYRTGDSLGQALWRGVFTAISAFCNAGFALQSTNLVPYQGEPLILHTVAALIIFGGIAPATTLLIPKWIAGKNIPVAPYIALITTFILLISGTLFILVFDWNGVLSGLSIAEKIHNAWFQSVTLRTAGFNSVDIAGITNPTFLVMICLMFIGGSPGGTAGGVKTTTIGIMFLTFWTNITNNKSVVILNRRIQSRVIYRAITIIASGVLTWIVMVLMLEITQQISVRDIIFEVTSAMGTVGLSTGATVKLDEMGKIIIMIAMFAGRIGPITIFMLLSEERSDNSSRYQNAKISLT